MTEVEVSYAGFGRRLGAYLIDNAIIVTFNILMLIIFVVAMTLLDEDFQLRTLMLAEVFGASVSAWIWTVLEPGLVTAYFIFHWRMWGATPGQWMFDIQVASTDLQPLTLAQAFLRWLGFLLSTFTAGLGFLWALFDPQQQGIHDKLARTIVVRRSELEEAKVLAEAEEEVLIERIHQLEMEVDAYEPVAPLPSGQAALKPEGQPESRSAPAAGA